MLVLSACSGSGTVPRGYGSPQSTAGQHRRSPRIDTVAIDKIVNQSNPLDFGVELGIYQNGEPLYEHGYGRRDFGLAKPYNTFDGPNFWRVPQAPAVLHLTRGVFAPDASSIYQLESVSKQFTAGAILLLQQDGKLSVNDMLSKYFPTIKLADTIPLLWLLRQRSGFVDCSSFGGKHSFTKAYRQFLASGNTDYNAIVNVLAAHPFIKNPKK